MYRTLPFCGELPTTVLILTTQYSFNSPRESAVKKLGKVINSISLNEEKTQRERLIVCLLFCTKYRAYSKKS